MMIWAKKNYHIFGKSVSFWATLKSEDQKRKKRQPDWQATKVIFVRGKCKDKVRDPGGQVQGQSSRSGWPALSVLGCHMWKSLFKIKRPVASNPGPHRHRIYDRREEGLVKPPFCFASLPTTVGKISTQNSEQRAAVFKSVFFFDSQKRRRVARRRLRSSRYKHSAKPMATVFYRGFYIG